ncbi:hypothetical protein [Bradyrhizobium sp. Ai1a-2]|nr:hypothetical protein [Bradyrhizobium sp. Ai1a-2]
MDELDVANLEFHAFDSSEGAEPADHVTQINGQPRPLFHGFAT